MYGITIEAQGAQSQYRQLLDQLRTRILAGAIEGNARLASSRALAASLGLARGIVLEVFEQLKAEGYLEGARGSGTFVRPGLAWTGPGDGPPARRPAGSAAAAPLLPDGPAAGRLSFAPGMPDLGLFPRRKWLECYHQAVEYARDEDLGYNQGAGRLDLREAIARHLQARKGLMVGPERIIVTAGSSQAFALLAQLFPSCRVLMEDPQAPFVRRIFQGLGCRLSYAPVDESGLRVDGLDESPQDLVYLCPAHQFPLGVCLPAERRLALLRHASRIGAWVVEDDFDSEFRYDRHPLAPLQALAPERVIYVGSFSKTLSPALRLGYAALPPGLVSRAKVLKRRWDFWNEGFQQKAMALFIALGYLDRHLNRSFRVYRHKNSQLRALVAAHLEPAWRMLDASTGMHLVIRLRDPAALPQGIAALRAALREQGLLVQSVADYCQSGNAFGDSLILGYGNHSEPDLERLVLAIKAQHRAG